MFGINPLMMTVTRIPAITKLNPADKAAGVTLSNDDLTASASTAAFSVRGTVSKSSGKWCFECTFDAIATNTGCGLANSTYSVTATPGGTTNSIILRANGQIVRSSVIGNLGVAFAAGDRALIALDRDAGTVWLGRNGIWDGDPAAGTGGYAAPASALFPLVSPSGTAAFGQITANFGDGFLYPIPSGFLAWG